ncbi:MAG: VOC family protein [Euryarchaeota archaeon]|jgi:catechol 2,3-dioxygenase-like lactoylglutathione lyase family enzyme|nr:VOC family protein [Euryarchaeota archaeon]MBT3970993.1 VOC family protein [Euryarchaeota archaeon]MBT4406704.1 VOC family protein [Euryarchaeota archaeon]MBT6644997.1 VOC family protein [Euryarchaeota archaeon]
MDSYLEHANITVIDVDEAIRFLQTAMPDWKVRADVSDEESNCRRWVHLGTDTNYIAIEDRGAKGKGLHEPYVDPGLNHLGFVVPDVAAVSKRLIEAGFTEGMSSLDNPNRKRIYFYDADENEYEFVEYIKSDFTSQNDYSDA